MNYFNWIKQNIIYLTIGFLIMYFNGLPLLNNIVLFFVVSIFCFQPEAPENKGVTGGGTEYIDFNGKLNKIK